MSRHSADFSAEGVARILDRLGEDAERRDAARVKWPRRTVSLSTGRWIPHGACAGSGCQRCLDGQVPERRGDVGR